MHDSTKREVLLLRGYAAVATALLAVFSLAAFRQQPRHERFGVIDVERINVIEPDGTPRLTISDKALFPDPVVGGKAYPLRSGPKRAGMIFFNDEGNENGGLVYAGHKTPAGHDAVASLTFDQFDQDEAVALDYQDVSGRRGAGLTISDRSEHPIQPCADSVSRAMQIADTAQRTRSMARLRGVCATELSAKPRLALGKSAAKGSFVVLSDRDGKPRLRLSVDSLGAPSVEFLDAAGHVTSRLPRADGQ
jgi:hypothetical protein